MSNRALHGALPRVIAFLIALAGLAALAWTLDRRDARRAASHGPMVCATDDTSRHSPLFRARIADAALLSLDRTPVMLHAVAGSRLTAVIFCSSKCPCSDGYVDRLRALRDRYGPRGVAFLAVNSNNGETFDDLKSYATRRGYPLPLYRDQDGIVADAMGARVTPEAFVFGPGWTLEYHGRIDDDKGGEHVRDRSLQAALDTLLAGSPLHAREKPSLGCAIDRSSR